MSMKYLIYGEVPSKFFRFGYYWILKYSLGCDNINFGVSKLPGPEASCSVAVLSLPFIFCL